MSLVFKTKPVIVKVDNNFIKIPLLTYINIICKKYELGEFDIYLKYAKTKSLNIKQQCLKSMLVRIKPQTKSKKPYGTFFDSDKVIKPKQKEEKVLKGAGIKKSIFDSDGSEDLEKEFNKSNKNENNNIKNDK